MRTCMCLGDEPWKRKWRYQGSTFVSLPLFSIIFNHSRQKPHRQSLPQRVLFCITELLAICWGIKIVIKMIKGYVEEVVVCCQNCNCMNALVTCFLLFSWTTLIKEETNDKWSLVVFSLHEKDAITKLLRDKPKRSWFNESEIK